MLPEILTTEDVAALMHCAATTVQERARAGELPGLQWGKDWVFPREATLAALNRQAVEEADLRRGRKTAPPSAVLHAIGAPAPGPQRGGKGPRRPPALPVLGAG